MVTNKTYEYGIKYKIIKVDESNFFLKPVGIVGGLSDGDIFSTNYGFFPILINETDLKSKIIIDNVFNTEDLEKIYDYYEDTDFLAKVFLDDYKEIYYYVNVAEDNKLKKYEIRKIDFEKTSNDVIYKINKGIPSITLNQDNFNELLGCKDLDSIKILLHKYRLLLNKFNTYSKEKGVTRIHIRDGKISSFDTDKDVSKIKLDLDKKSVKQEYICNEDITYDGLRKAIKEKIIGHDEQIDTFAQKLYMNYTAVDGETVESILLVGPTGTGKTETVKAACSYLSLPFVSVNASNLVPQGIKGIYIEKLLKDLYVKSKQNLKLAERGVVFLDEFDKLNSNNAPELKGPVKDILLSFADGAKIPVSTDDYEFEFNSKMTNKIYAGVFEEITKKEKSMGFGTKEESILLEDGEKIRERIIEKKYYTLEELSRINTILGFNDLTRDEKKKILLSSKLSEFANKRDRYKRQFGIDIILDEEYIDTILDNISSVATGMRTVNNIVKKSIDDAEKEILSSYGKGYKKLILTKNTVLDSKKYDIM